MAVIRVEKNGNYTVMSNYHLKDKTMSLKTKGLLSLMLSLPDDWDYSVAGLVVLSSDGKDAVTAALKELEKKGYLERNAIREKGKIVDWEYHIYEHPKTNNKEPLTEKPQVEKPLTEKPLTEKPQVENPSQLNTNKSNTKKLSINKLKTKEKTDIFSQYANSNEELLKALIEFENMRKSIKKPMTDNAKRLLVNKLDKLALDDLTKIEILNQSIFKCWQDVYPLKTEEQNYQHQNFSKKTDNFSFTDIANMEGF